MNSLFLFLSLYAFAFGGKPANPTAPPPADSVDEKFLAMKPKSGETALANEKCTKLSEEGKARNAKLLLIGFEGLDGFSPDAVLLTYRYHWKLAHGISASKPELGTIAPVNHRLMIPLIEQFKGKIEYLSYPEYSVSDQSGSVPEICAAVWLGGGTKAIAGRRVIVMGHSFGGKAAEQLAQALNRRGISLDQIYTMDPRPKGFAGSFRKPANVRLWNNFYQKNASYNGYVVAEANLNKDMSSFGVNHGTIVRHPFVMETILREINVE